jgi:hypothetical protein
MVTGPSFAISTSIFAPKLLRATSMPSLSSASEKRFVERFRPLGRRRVREARPVALRLLDNPAALGVGPWLPVVR